MRSQHVVVSSGSAVKWSVDARTHNDRTPVPGSNEVCCAAVKVTRAASPVTMASMLMDYCVWCCAKVIRDDERGLRGRGLVKGSVAGSRRICGAQRERPIRISN